jgi:2-polyprenyl-6-methoxyphenol hydroxylase-like FAD-dependent oxidoreductase
MTRRVLVVGAGVAGLATARALCGAGFEVTVVERRPGAPLPGLGLNLPGNAVRALDALGVADQVLAAGIPVTRREYRTARGRLLFALAESSYWAGVAPSVCVRPGLVLDALGTGQEVRRGVGVVHVDTSPHRPHVAFSDGSEEVCDLVVGADGIHSTVRGAVVTTTPRASVMTTASWRFVVPNPGVDCWTVWTGGGLTLLLIPVDTGEAYGYASSSKGGAAGADPRWLAQAFARFPTPTRRAVEAALETGRAPYHSPVEEIRIDTWHRGPVVLVGDAAHATGPVWAQGAAAALEDALVLAEMLGSRSDWTAAVSAWELRRRPRVDHVQAATDRMSHLARLPDCLSHNLAPFAGPRAYRAAYGPLRERP